MEQALGNHLIVSNILPYISFDDGILGCRLINKCWNEQVLIEYSKRDNIFLNLKKYLNQRQRKLSIAADSPLPNRIYIDGRISIREITKFFSCHDVETIRMDTIEQLCYLRKSLFEAFQGGLCPNLKHIKIEQHYHGAGQFLQPELDPHVILRNLKTLSVKSHSGGFFPAFAQSLLKVSTNLEVLSIKDIKSLPTLCLYGNLKEVMFTSSNLSNIVPEFEKFLQQLSPTLEVLRFGTTWKTSDLLETSFNLPIMPKLRTFSVLDLILNPFLFGGDIISFINEKIPALETLQIRDYWEDRFRREDVVQFDTIIHAINRSEQRNNTLKSLSIQGPKDPYLIYEIKKKFTALKRINISSHIEQPSTWDPRNIVPLAFVLARSEVEENVITLYCRNNIVIVREKAMEAIRAKSGWGVFRDLRSAFFHRAGEDGPTVWIKVEDPWRQYNNLGFSNC